MSKIYLMVTITDRNQNGKFLTFYQQYGVGQSLNMLGRGTASSEALGYFGLEATDKAVLLSCVTDTTWKEVKSGLQQKMMIDVPGTGVVFTVPFSSVAGRTQLQALLGAQAFEKGEESALKDTKYELVVVIANQGYTDQIVDASRKAGASGGTILHAKGTGLGGPDHFLGVSLASEKEAILMVLKKENKNAIMEAIMQEIGHKSKAKTVIFSLPVTSTAGLRLAEIREEELAEADKAEYDGTQR